MLGIVICEDNEVHRNNLKQIIENTILREGLDLNILLSTGKPEELLDFLKNNNTVGIYFLDVDLKSNINGVRLGEKIREIDPLGYIIFTTTHLEMSYLAFKYMVEAMDYIDKDEDNYKERISKCILKAYNSYYKEKNNEEVISINSDGRGINLKPSDILFIETTTTAHKIRIHEENRQIEVYANLKDIQNKLPANYYRCHKSYIVNKNKIKEVNKKEYKITMINEEECYVSIRYLRGLLSESR